ncbi:hypothetical protein RB195_014020 [Necator americanus]
MQYVMYIEDNEELAANGRQQLMSFVDPCHELPANGSEDEHKNKINEHLIRCEDGEILDRAGEGYVERHCQNEKKTSGRSLFLRRISYTEEQCSCKIRCEDGTEFFRFAGCRCPHDEFALPDAGCLDPDCIWKPDISRGWTITNATDNKWERIRSETFREEKDYRTRRPHLGQFEAGHFTQPVRLRIECRSEGDAPTMQNSATTECQLGKIVWDDECIAGSSSMPTCELDSKLCDLPGHLRCMDDLLCDLAPDCSNGSDEESCDEQPAHSRCDFNDERAFCDDWTMLTVEQGIPTDHHLLQVKRPIKNVGPIHEARPGGGPFLLYSTEINRNQSLSTRDTFFTSPFHRPIFNDEAKCKLRFRTVRAGADVEWSMSVIHPPWVKGVKPLKISFEEEGRRLQRSWHRISTNIGPQLFPFAIQIEANWVVTSSATGNSFVAVDDISLSVECFDEADQLSPLGDWTSMTIDTCGATGTQRIKRGKCLQRGHRKGPYQFLLIDHQQQIWTVPETLHYRLVACGAEGGSFPSEDVSNGGGCVTADLDLVIGNKLHFSIGQKGESPCDNSVTTPMEKEVRERLCSGKYVDIWLNSSQIHGTGGGGPTTVSLDSTYIIVAAGGGGTYPREFIDGVPKNPAGGLLKSKSSGISERFQMNAGHGISISSPSQQLWSCGDFPNFGGIAAPCDPAAGGGGGYHGGSAQIRNHGLGGSNWIGVNASSYLLEVGARKGDGVVIIYACRLQCPAKSTCFFPNLESAEDMGCLCEYGEIVSPTGICADSKVASLLLQHKFAVMVLLFCLSMCLLGIIQMLRKAYKKLPTTAADQIKLVVMQSDYKDVDVGESYWDQIACLPCLPWNEINIGREIGTGAFGTVHEGRTKDGKGFAVKTICMNKSTSAEAQREFAFEALFMHKFNHPNIVRLHWIQWEPPRLRIILELMEGGDLRSFLREARPTHENMNPFNLNILEIVNISLDIARGCEELNRQKYIHRDLAARNCLLTEKGPNRRAKIGDFGMARDIYENNYYRKGGRAKLPVRWMPPEAFLDGLFTTQTDVWSFGVVLWEISSFGMLPYFGVDNFDVMGLVTNGGRLDAPSNVPIELQEVMRNCWNTKADERPSFSKIVATLELLSQKKELARMPICYLIPTSPTPVSPCLVECSTPLMQPPSPFADTPCTAVTALSPSSPDRAGFGISMTGVPYIPINSGALREVFQEKSARKDEERNSDLEKLVDSDSNADAHGQFSGIVGENIDDTIAKVKQALFGSRVPPTPPPRRPTSLPRLRYN